MISVEQFGPNLEFKLSKDGDLFTLKEFLDTYQPVTEQEMCDSLNKKSEEAKSNDPN